MRGKAHIGNAGWLWLLIAAALFVRAVVPQGFMPERDASGALTITVCHGDATVQVPLGKKDQPGDTAHKDQPCAFGGLFAAADTGIDIVLPPPPAVRELRLVAPERVLATQALFPRPPSRGPPSLV